MKNSSKSCANPSSFLTWRNCLSTDWAVITSFPACTLWLHITHYTCDEKRKKNVKNPPNQSFILPFGRFPWHNLPKPSLTSYENLEIQHFPDSADSSQVSKLKKYKIKPKQIVIRFSFKCYVIWSVCWNECGEWWKIKYITHSISTCIFVYFVLRFW